MLPIRDRNPSVGTPWVTMGLIVANATVFLAHWSAWGTVLGPLLHATRAGAIAEQEFFLQWGMTPARLAAGSGYVTLLTSMFIHGGWLHIAGNMLFLWIFGDNLEDVLGRARFLLFYLACGIASALVQALADPGSTAPTVGASGAIAGVLGGYLLLFPRAKVEILIIFIVFFRIFAIPAWMMLGLWFGLQLWGGARDVTSSGGIAYWAHTGGFVIGMALIWPAWAARGGRRSWSRDPGASRLRVPSVRRR